MNDTYILYNPYAGNGSGEAAMERLCRIMADRNTTPLSLTDIVDYADFLDRLDSTDELVICGGDGTLNRFVNDIDGIHIPCDILYYAAGSGNDFLKDVGKEPGCAPFSIKEYIIDLPVITVKGIRRRFINGTGLGLDGYCCAEVGKARQKTSGKVGYIRIALQGLLWKYIPSKATVTVDGKTYEYSRVWLATTMQGRYFGGGVMAAPTQDRSNADGTVTLAVMCNVSRLRALTIFPTLMNGTHLKYKKVVHMHPGHRIQVKLDKPVILQIDGETYPDVQEYTVEAGR